MFLKRIEMENFKSFGKRTVIDFKRGYTSITGPNASGKSNIGDALLFVLGTKSNKVLRAQKLTDLIHRNNSGKLSPYLKASVTFDNSDKSIPLDSNEVTFTRVVKLSESNDDYSSYYFINEDKARLQDFEYLLEKAKIFADGYNFVRQGDITSIVEMTPNERRGILEEVGGISAYNQEIQKTGEDRNKVQENMLTVQALITEISTRVELLSSEKDQAQLYLDKKNEMNKLEGILKHRKKAEIEREITTINEQISRINKEIGDADISIKNLVTKNNELEDRLKNLEKDNREIEEFQRIKADLDSKKLIYAKGQMELDNLEEKISGSRTEIEELKKRKKKLEDELFSLNKDFTDQENNFKREKEKLTSLERQIEELDNKSRDSINRNDELNKKIETLRKEKDKVMNEFNSISSEEAKLEAKKNSLIEEISKGEEEVQTIEFSIKDNDWRIKNLNKVDNTSDSLKKRYLEIKNKSSALRQEEELLTREIEKLEGEAGRIQGVKLSGIWDSINFILSEASKGSLKGIKGTVDSLISYSKEHEKAVRAAGGSRLQSIVVETDADAQAAIELLKKREKGRLTFLPLNKIIPLRPKGKSLMLSQDKRTLGLLINNINYDKSLDSIVSYVLSDTILVSDMNVAREIMGGVRIVTLDGDLIDPSNAMTGGNLGKREIEKDIESITSKLSNLKNKRKEIRDELNELEEELRSITEKINKANVEAGKGEGTYQQLTERKKELEEQLRKKKDYLDGRKRLLELNKDEISRIKNQVLSLSKELSSIDESIEKTNKERDSLLDKETRDKISSLKVQFNQQKGIVDSFMVGLNDLKVKRGSLNATINSINESISAEDRDLKSNEELKKKLLDETAKMKNEIEAISLIYDKMESKLKEKGKEIEQLNNEKFKVRSEIDSLNTVKKTKFDFMLSLQSKISDAEQRLNEIKREIEDRKLSFSDDHRSSEEIRKEITLIENTLKQMEPVNLKSIDDYNQESLRLKELKDKKEHLELEISKLQDLEKRLEEQKKIVFLEVFEKVNENFINIYRELTNGGEGYLYLENVTNPFDGGLFIRASSKGKKVDNLASLSGGEKSLAALSFIIAIQQYDPSPIYFMDEVDMFLDGVNAENVGRMFRRNSDSAQIIAVTLRKSTMKYAHQMIGVTYQDRSSIVITKDMGQEEQVIS